MVREAVVIFTGMDETLTAEVPGLTPEDKPTFNWTISPGKIVSGQGTSTVVVTTDLEMGHELTVAVEVDGVSARSPQCDRRASETLRVYEYFCPNLHITCPTGGEYGTPLSITLNVSGGDPDVEVKYNWMVSAGKIIAGQGTPAITVDTKSLAGQALTATVEVVGFPSWCDRTESCSVLFESWPPPRKVDDYGNVGRVKENARLANFAIALRREPGAQGYIFYYGPRGVDQRLSRAQKLLAGKFGIDPSRITGVNAGYSKKFAVQLWIRPTGAGAPEPRF